VSNADNLGAVIDVKILGYFANGRFPFMMEVADRTEMDKKGGHLARHADGHLLLRESAQCHDDDVDAFQDINRHRYFNTNNLWLHLPTLQKVMDERDNQLGLPLLRNAKTIDPRDADSTAVYQIETAMGSAIALFPGATALRVPRSRFAPVKETNDLLAVRSDAYELMDDYRIVPRADKLVVELDGDVYKLVDELNGRFPHGSPSLIDCTSLRIKGDVAFGRDIVCRGDVLLDNQSDKQVSIPDGTVLEGVLRMN
jgi:UTP--glucose-1-phosphate uridylyltransferase